MENALQDEKNLLQDEKNTYTGFPGFVIFGERTEEMQPARTFRDLVVWQKAHQYALLVYQHTSKFPKTEIFGLTSQYRRAAVSVAANIAEGFKKRGIKDKARFLNTAQGSLEECRYYELLSKDLNYGNTDQLSPHLQEISRLLTGYYNAIKQSKGQVSSSQL